jgi:hypothetical protein
VALVFYRPVALGVSGQVGGPGLFSGQCGDAEDGLLALPGARAGLLAAAGDLEDLGGMGEVDAVGGCDADLAGLDAAVPARAVGVELTVGLVERSGPREAGRSGVPQVRLVAFDRQDVGRFVVGDERFGSGALGVQGIEGQDGTLQVDALEQGSGLLIWNHTHLLHALRAFETHYNEHRPHRTLHQAAPLRPAPEPITEQARIIHLDIRRRDRLGGILHEYEHAA